MTLPSVPNDGVARPSADLSALAIDRSSSLKPQKRFNNRLTKLTLLAALTAAVFIGLIWRQAGQLVVETALVTNVYPSQALTLLNATGYVVAQRKSSVASKATGRLEWLGVQESSKVRAGDVIARLENRDSQALRDQAAANVQVAQANLGQGRAELAEAELVFKRSEDLIAKKMISDSAHDSAVSRLAKARAGLAGYQAAVEVAKANLRVAEVALDQTLIRAPFDGVVLTRNANVGDTITPFSQALDTKGAVVTIADMDTLEVEADVAESSLAAIRTGLPVEIQLDAFSGQRFEGVVSRTVPTVDRAMASILVKIRFVRRDPRILPDMSAKVAFLERPVLETERKPLLALPEAAIVETGGRKQVYVIENDKARLRPVELGGKTGSLIEVHGLNVGTRVIIDPPPDLTDGRSVKQRTK